ncbi:LPXTG cell wall anchor domain-containing protein [Demequina sp. B12]|uniref:LPXTG cell wall anchor domain-containing protein n=1 Tax=Demequina sp. B12 TaxID=2992757 RepID=UPI00237C08F8|nr:LPXTG cell wall anchor domain-containing protein [Demequina sp. B12]MDE0572556.1 LPXTG cell wall anchor domain-containing protein [Demequina sp. B12]
MKLTRLRASAAAACAATVLTIGVGTPALAHDTADTADPAQIATAAQAAADAANQAFIDADWDTVRVELDTFSALLSQLKGIKGDRTAALDEARTVLADAVNALNLARTEFNAKKSARDDARAALTTVQDQIAAVAADIAAGESDLADLQLALPGLQQAVSDLEAALAAALLVEADAQGAYDSALATFNGPVPTGDGVGALLTSLGISAPAYSEVEGQRDAAQAEAETTSATASALRTVANDADETADGLEWDAFTFPALERFYWCGGFCTTDAYQAALDAASEARELADDADDAADEAEAIAVGAALRSGWWDSIASIVDVDAARADVDTALEELTAATAAVVLIGGVEKDGSVSGTLFDARAALAAHESDIAELEDELDALDKDVRDLKAQLPGLRDSLAQAKAALDEARGALDDARADRETAQGGVDAARAAVDQVKALLDGLGAAEGDVADRRADLADLEQVWSEVVWSAGDNPGVVRPGDVVSISFTIPGSTLFALQNAQVTVLSPVGLEASCDVPEDGVVAANATVSCTVSYEVTEADVASGTVTLAVELRGFIPLGPGNPRARAATMTLIEATHHVQVDVEALPVIPAVEPVSVPAAAPAATADEDPTPTTTAAALPATGSDLGLMTPAAILIAAGAALLFVRRRMGV